MAKFRVYLKVKKWKELKNLRNHIRIFEFLKIFDHIFKQVTSIPRSWLNAKKVHRKKVSCLIRTRSCINGLLDKLWRIYTLFSPWIRHPKAWKTELPLRRLCSTDAFSIGLETGPILLFFRSVSFKVWIIIIVWQFTTYSVTCFQSSKHLKNSILILCIHCFIW